ncbi:MAG: transposase [Desulfomonile tiedjei]|nr:transposase [Desulfomonile tiedjei]
MSRRIYDEPGHVHFVTFSCFKRRRLLDDDHAKSIVTGNLARQLAKRESRCFGFVVMPDHVHALLWFPSNGVLSDLIKWWKQRSSFEIKQLLEGRTQRYADAIDLRDPVWQPRYYDFNVYSEEKLLEKLEYMHSNPVKAGFVDVPCDWEFSSARFYATGELVGVPIRSWNEL